MNNLDLLNTESAIGLYSYGQSSPGQVLFSKFYSSVVDLLKQNNIEPTYIGAQGKGYSGKLTKIGGSSHRKLIKTDFSGIKVLSISANPTNSDEPAYDRFVSASISYLNAAKEILLCFVINEYFIPIFSKEFDYILDYYINNFDWDFGYAFSEEKDKNPEFYILNLDNGQLSEEEEKSLIDWYSTSPEDRITKIRDIFPYNLLNKKQIKTKISNDFTFEEFIIQQSNISFKKLNKKDLYTLKIHNQSTVNLIRTKLKDTQILV